ncbi:hypothetical protein Tco_1331242 [Tanacetum coccineum]
MDNSQGQPSLFAEENLKRDCPRECRVRGMGKFQVQMSYGSSFMLDNIRFNGSEEYKNTFTRSGVGTGLVQVLQGVEFEVEPRKDHAFEVERLRNIAHELFRYIEDNNEAAFSIATLDKIYAYELLNFNDTITGEVISKWKAGLNEDIDARSNVYVLNNGCKECSNDINDYYWEYAPTKGNVLGLKIVRDQSGNTLRVLQSRFHNGKLIQTLLEGHTIFLLDVEKRSKASYIRAVGNHEYHIVYTRPDISYADVGILDGFNRGL